MIPEPPAFVEVAAPGGEALRIPVSFVRSERSRSLRLSLKPGPRAQVGMPRGSTLAEAIRFLDSHRAWLARAVAKLGPAGEPGVARHLEKFPWVSVEGKLCVIESETISGRPFFVRKSGEDFVLFRHRAGERAETDLRFLLLRLAAETLPGRTSWLAGQARLSIGRVTVRDQRGRWGSCGATGTISLNWRLVLLPPALQDHVILHELAHRSHMDHSEKFWNRLATLDPDWRTNDSSLTKNWSRLMDLARGEEEEESGG